MTKRFLILALMAIFMDSFAGEIDKPLKADFCDVVINPQTFDGKTIEVTALQLRLKKNEWGLSGDTCLPKVLLVLPKDVSPVPQFILEETPALKELLAARNERASFRAAFVGRFEWSRQAKKGLFGKSKLNMRFVLQSVSNPVKILLPYK